MKSITIIGLGYVGLPLALHFARRGVTVLGLDIDPGKTEKLNRGESYIKHLSSNDLQKVVKAGHFSATTDFARLSETEAILICVPTPLDRHREPDMSFVFGTAESIAPHLQRGQLVVLESTTYPGTTEDDVRPILESGSGLKAGEDFYLAYSPEREDPGNPDSAVDRIPKVVGGCTTECRDRAVTLYEKVVKQVVPVSSCRVAEASKLLENIFRSINIALVNELKVIYDAMGIDVWDVIAAASTKPFGYMPFYPGPGLGGHCIPIDPFYLSWKAREYGRHTRFIELAGEINTAMPDYVISKVFAALNQEGKAINGSRILLLGLAYKPDVDDDRESPSYVIMEKLEDLSAEVSYNDPNVPRIRPSREYSHYAGQKSVPVDDSYDLILLLTAHREYKTFDFSNFTTPIVDTRNCITTRPIKYHQA